MKLSQELANMAAQNRSAMPVEIQTVMEQAKASLVNSGTFNRLLKVGDSIPPLALLNAAGQLIEIQTLLQTGPAVISFYRGRWCPYCSLELLAWQRVLPEIKACGATLVAISPQTAEHSRATVKTHHLQFEVLSDPGNWVAHQFGLAFTVPETVRPIYRQFGIDLLAINGDATFGLPLPATYVVSPDGVVVHAAVQFDYAERQDPEEIVAILAGFLP
jgi:peroxiredoxin